ncbi:MAG: AcrB/AcrD/AcrF family protein [Alphaproteobacteria bacterium CG_4_10_14_0_2_um_filter_63_37]|nr:MAG: hypothetical protein AUJ55_05235 [Proteobacteria bacterium CG1_02_64_396]PJA25092.1 MAG: AcrB/AcrD/AcrF family protein [Alphaproteobacteria bacterium CG_4_10_14_0_2_um_filter_63_37]
MIDALLKRGVTVTVMALLTILVGALSLQIIPVQLIPEIESGAITVEARWGGASPEEVERELIVPLEDLLAGTEGVESLSAQCFENLGRLKLELAPGTDLDGTLVRVSNRLTRLKDWPQDADRPSLSTAGSDDQPIAWIILSRKEGVDTPIAAFGDLAEDVIRPRLERISGVAAVNVFGAPEEQVVIHLDPDKLARLGLRVDQVQRAVQTSFRTVSAGSVDEDRRHVLIRVVGEQPDPQALGEVVLIGSDLHAVRLKDVATIAMEPKRFDVMVRQKGAPSIAVNVVRQAGTNTLEIMDQIYKAIDDLNTGPVGRAGANLLQVYDATIYIHASLDQVAQNLVMGGGLAVVILLLFLRNLRATAIVGVAIPISVIGAFAFMALTGRSVNVISLAGMTFAIGMLVDAAIVVQENIDRLLRQGKTPLQAASQGIKEVMGAIFISTATTVVVLIPLLVSQETIGQLFRDIAVAVIAAVTLSMLVASSVIPTASRRWLRPGASGSEVLPLLTRPMRRFLRWVVATRKRAAMVALSIIAATLGGAQALLPPAEYLPTGNRNLAFGVLIPPPGMSLETLTQIGKNIEADLGPHWDQNNPVEPAITSFFFVARGQAVFMGARAADGEKIDDLVAVMQKSIGQIPGLFGIVQKASLFGRSIGTGRSIDLRLTGPNYETLMPAIFQTFMTLKGALPDLPMRPMPGLTLGQPQWQVVPDLERCLQLGLPPDVVARTVDVFADEAVIGDFLRHGKAIDLMLAGPGEQLDSLDDLPLLPIALDGGGIVLLQDVAAISETNAPNEIDREDRERAVTIRITPPETLAMSDAVEQVEAAIAPLKTGFAEQGIVATSRGTVDDLTKATGMMTFQVGLAVLLTFLLMAALFEAWKPALAVMAVVPTAFFGGLAGYWLLHSIVPTAGFDTLTMLGFVILVGIVVNNAILIVHQGRHLVANEGMNRVDAIVEGAVSRVRPIVMSTLTTVGGLLPMVVRGGAGSELYQGLGAVLLGGLAISATLALVVVPAADRFIGGGEEEQSGG